MNQAEKTKETIQLVRDLSNELAGHLHSLPDDIWRNADGYGSPCEGWKIADVITHLVLGANTFHQSISRALIGETGPPMGHDPAADPEARLLRLVETRDAIYEDLFYEFNATCRRLNTLLTSLEPDGYDLPTWHPFFQTTVTRLIDIRASELAVHGWDIRYPLDRSACISKRAVPFLLEFLWRWFRTGFQKGDALETPVTYRFSLSDSDDAAYDVVIAGDGFRLGPSGAATPDVTFYCDADAYILFNMGRLPFQRAVRRGRMKFDGDDSLAEAYSHWFRPV